ncbi:de-hypoxanthine futalosine cyclase [Desulfonatronum thiosulfatophilum]|uniref:Cyclic dehypoxanthine futalosine synthase n=1 Tax=Desulfonatronum thiosulfatophilum TaxID=617002 RepID=A0A1G6CC10_9BACT|nr:cyclic dehypoxanthinyl futalosine synthase [Desulfonatronum thiosulfatophilum]SDB30384.1 de-hypoxanthine futalosine cyclase [Desulfonatronum thiosulfatophilum]
MAQQRITTTEALKLWNEQDVIELGAMAHARRMALHPRPVVTYIVDRNINYTNICVSGCRFCAFYRPPGHAEGYVLSREELGIKVQETLELGGRQILLQGGMNPELGLDYYLEMLRFLKRDFPEVAVHGFSPPEIAYLAESSGLSIADVVARLSEAGLDSIPGGGAEILVDHVRDRISPQKCSADAWLEVMACAHGQGLKTTATMMFGHGESIKDRLEHLEKLRALQDATGGFTAFIPWTFQPRNTKIDVPEASSVEYLKFLALSRLFLDNIPHIQASWVTQGPSVGQMALLWGADDMGSTMIEENVVAAAGVRFLLPEEELRAIVQGAGFTPMRRKMDYTLVEAEQE